MLTRCKKTALQNALRYNFAALSPASFLNSRVKKSFPSMLF